MSIALTNRVEVLEKDLVHMSELIIQLQQEIKLLKDGNTKVSEPDTKRRK